MKKLLTIILSLIFLVVASGCMADSPSTDSSSYENDDEYNYDNGAADDNENTIEYVIFGSYEQDGDTSNGAEAIEWIPLAEEDGKTLLISRYILEYKDFNDTTIAKATSWKNSSLRKWLNDSFYKSAFTSAEQKQIQTTQVQDYKKDGALGEITSDKVFLMNKEQAFSYFATDYDRATTSTAYANTQKSYVTNSYWLIDSYSSDLYEYLINSKGRNENNPRVNESEGIRPMIWIAN